MRGGCRAGRYRFVDGQGRRASGAELIFAVDPLAKRRALALEYGAHHAIDPFAIDAALEIKELTGGAGVDVAIEISGHYAALDTAIRAARFGGTVCQAGAISGNAAELWLGREFLANSLKMIVPRGNGAMEYAPADYPLWDQYRIYDTIVSKMKQGELTVPGLIDPLVSIKDFPEVFELIKRKPEDVVKYGVRFSVEEVFEKDLLRFGCARSGISVTLKNAVGFRTAYCAKTPELDKMVRGEAAHVASLATAGLQSWRKRGWICSNVPA